MKQRVEGKEGKKEKNVLNSNLDQFGSKENA